MFNCFVKGFLLSALMFLVACSSSTGPVVIRDAGQEPRVSVPEKNKEAVSGNQQRSSDNKVAPTVVHPVEPARRSSASQSPLTQQLLAQARQKLAKKKPGDAIVLAERGLRIDRKEPQFYEVLAAAYHMQGNRTQSADFARQGLRYAQPNSDNYRRLQAWLP